MTAPSDAYVPRAIELERASVRIGRNEIWSDVSMSMGRGEFVALLGGNGSGKSTLLKVLLGAIPLASGSVSVLGRAVGAGNGAIGYLPQRRSFDEGTRLRGSDIVRLGLDGDRWGLPLPLAFGRSAARQRAARERIAEVIEMVSAGAYAGRPIGELSGGEQQRLLIAQALVRKPELLLLDEPLDSLDLPTQASVAALVHEVCREAGVGVLIVAHDVNPLLPYVDRVVYLAGGRAVAGPVEQVITSETLTALHGLTVEVLRASDGRLVVVGQPDAPAHHHDRHAHAPAHDHIHAHAT
ncbi:MAG TPA: ATP-binding cassette domain-containing protein [Solirubrobacteraceae bacterium]|jgi:zinc/manganese transport system ATP-binding protein|nr:ATP-binding cassette domain-containing protein [Solirubrobacteraceae bacterium]